MSRRTRRLNIPILMTTVLGGGSVATDLVLPETNQLAFWYAGNGATQPDAVDSAGDGEAVSSWTSGSYAPANTLSNRPIYRVSKNGRGALEFANQYLVQNSAVGILANQTTYNAHIVFRKDPLAAQDYMYFEGSSGGTTPRVAIGTGFTSAGTISFVHRDDANTLVFFNAVDVDADDDEIHVLTVRRVVNAWAMLWDGVQVAATTTTIGTTTTNRVGIGAQVDITASNQYSGDVHAIALYSDDSYETVLPLLGGHYGVEMPPFSSGGFAYSSSIDGI